MLNCDLEWDNSAYVHTKFDFFRVWIFNNLFLMKCIAINETFTTGTAIIENPIQ